MDLLALLARHGDLPHGACFAGPPGLLWTRVGADGLIAVACVSIAVGFLAFTRHRPDHRVRWIAALFGAFIFACGITHLMDIWTIWQPDHALQAVTQVVTAAISLAAAVSLWRLVPASLKIPSADQLQGAIKRLELEVGKRRNAEEQAADFDQILALTLAAIDAGLITTDAAGNVVRMNAVAERITGWPQSEARGRSYWDVFVREGRPDGFRLKNVVDTAADQPSNVETAHRLVAISRDGARTPIEVNAALTHAEDGTVHGLLVVLKDMTHLDRAEDDMRRLAAIVESSSDAIIGKSLDGRITSWNRAACTLFGYTAQEAVGASVKMLIPPERAQEEMAILANITTGRVVPPFDTVRRRKDGSPVDVSITISPIRDAAGNIVGGSKIARDITQQLGTVAALRESQGRLRFALEVAEIGDWDLDLRTGVTSRSLRHDNCFGYDTLQSEWNIETSMLHIHPDDRDDVALAYREALLNRRDLAVECRVIWPDGSLHWIQVRGSTRYESGDTDRMLGIVTDITERRLAEQMRLRTQRLENDNRQILESNRLKSQFLANMSHELRSPLNAIIGFSDLLYSDKLPVELPTQHKFIGHIRTSGRHLLQLINDILDLSKVESGKFEFFPEPVDLAAVIAEVNGVLFAPLHKKRLAVDVLIDPQANAVVTDPARLKQALYNYLSNAIKFTPEGGQVTVRALRDGQDFRIEVEDTGIGIVASDLPKLFVEFQQLDSSVKKEHQGTGLGLALTRRLVEAQGGSVGVTSVLGQGSVFHLSLPMAPTPEPVAAPPAAETHFLVIEDHLPDQARIADALAGCGHQVDVACDLDEAVEHARTKVYDALTLDLLLDRRHGLDALERIRRGGPNSNSPVVAMTVAAEPSKTVAFSINDVLAKPLRADEVAAAIFSLGTARRAGATIMVIDDEPSALDLMSAALHDLGVQVVGYQDGRDALRELPLRHPAAIILDLMMPSFDGFQVLDQLSRMPQWSDIPVFVWTGMVLSEAEYESLAVSASAILRKGGGGLELLIERLRRWRPSPLLQGAS